MVMAYHMKSECRESSPKRVLRWNWYLLKSMLWVLSYWWSIWPLRRFNSKLQLRSLSPTLLEMSWSFVEMKVIKTVNSRKEKTSHGHCLRPNFEVVMCRVAYLWILSQFQDHVRCETHDDTYMDYVLNNPYGKHHEEGHFSVAARN